MQSKVMTLAIFTKKEQGPPAKCSIKLITVFFLNVGSLPTQNKELLVGLKERLLFKFKRGNPNYLSVAKITCIKNYTLFSTPEIIF